MSRPAAAKHSPYQTYSTLLCVYNASDYITHVQLIHQIFPTGAMSAPFVCALEWLSRSSEPL